MDAAKVTPNYGKMECRADALYVGFLLGRVSVTPKYGKMMEFLKKGKMMEFP